MRLQHPVALLPLGRNKTYSAFFVALAVVLVTAFAVTDGDAEHANKVDATFDDNVGVVREKSCPRDRESNASTDVGRMTIETTTEFERDGAGAWNNDDDDEEETNQTGRNDFADSDDAEGSTEQEKQEEEEEEEKRRQQQQQDENTKCKLYLAESTIPNAGMGMYTSIPLKRGSAVGYGDIVIPIVDIEFHNNQKHPDGSFFFLWSDYLWEADGLSMDREATRDTHGASPGLGSAANSWIVLKNIEDEYPTIDSAGLHRSNDPGVGAFSTYHDRQYHAKQDVPAGGELFVDYGEHYFKSRESIYGLVPFERDHVKADKLLYRMDRLIDKHMPCITENMQRDLWDVISNHPFESRVLNALPKSWEDVEDATEQGTVSLLIPGTVRSVEWLEQNGKCMDNIRPGNSTVPQAGRGAFATRFIPKGGLVAPAPLIHIPDKEILNIYEVDEDDDGETRITEESEVVGKQIMLNYCFGHRNSTLLLISYGAVTNFINHNSISPNARIQWAEGSANHRAEWLDYPVEALEDFFYSGLAFDYVAIRDIQPGEEVFIDYGSEWEQAWNEYVKNWSARGGAESMDYVPASVLNKDMITPLRTEFEQLHEPYPSNVEIKCRKVFKKMPPAFWKSLKNTNKLESHVSRYTRLVSCEILKREVDDGYTVYTAFLTQEGDSQKGNESTKDAAWKNTLYQVPREAFVFVDRPYSSDIHLPNAFRHEMMIPDDMFPKAWMNI